MKLARLVALLFLLPVALCLHGCPPKGGGEQAQSEEATPAEAEKPEEHAAQEQEAKAKPGQPEQAAKPLDLQAAQKILKTGTKEERRQIADQLRLALVGGKREQVKAMLIGLAKDPDAKVRASAMGGLAPLGDEVFEVLLAASRDEDGGVRKQALSGLVHTVGHVETVLARLEEMRADPSLEVREQAAGAADVLAGMGRLVAALGDPTLDRSARASYMLAPQPAAIEPLMRTIRTSQNPRQRAAAVSVLWTICSGQTPGQKAFAGWARSFYWHGAPKRPQANAVAVPLLMEVLERDPDPTVREAAAQGLGHCGDSRAVPALIAALEDKAEPVRRRAASALVVLPDPRAAASLTRLALGDKSAPVRRYATEALGWIGTKEAAAALVKGLQDEEPDVREMAAGHLARLRPVDGLKPLLALLNDPEEDVRWEAAKAVGAYADPSTKTALVACLSDPAPQVQNAAEQALRQFGYRRAAPGMQGAEPVQDEGEKLQRPPG